MAEIRLALRAWVSVSTTLRPSTFVVHRPTESSLDVEEWRETPYQTPPTTRARGTTTAAVRRTMLIRSPSPARQFACSASLRATPPARHGTTSTVPVTELRRNRRWLPPERSRALTTRPSDSVTLVPAVT